MGKPVEKAPGPAAPPSAKAREDLFEILLGSAIESFFTTIMVLVLGSIAVGMLGGIFHQMTPTPPPGFVTKPEAEGTVFSSLFAWGASFREHRLLVVFLLIFLPTAWCRLFGNDHMTGTGSPSTRMAKVRKKLLGDWFSLIIVNAFVAMICALVLAWTQRFTLTKILLGWLLQSVVPALQSVANLLLGHSRADSLQAWFHWYGENQLKFTFWFLYLAAVCDDLGIPNLKTLGRWALWRVRQQIRPQNPAVPESPAT